MTFNERGLLRVMKRDFKGYGYSVVRSDSGLVITGTGWGVAIMERLVPNEVKSLIVLKHLEMMQWVPVGEDCR